MPFRIILEKYHDQGSADLSVPTFICDYCKKPITEATDGNYLWNGNDQEYGPTDAREMYFTHKACNYAFEQGVKDVHLLAMGIDNLMVYLAHNLKLDWDKAKKNTEMLGML